jgi:hypothetical protein
MKKWKRRNKKKKKYRKPYRFSMEWCIGKAALMKFVQEDTLKYTFMGNTGMDEDPGD